MQSSTLNDRKRMSMTQSNLLSFSDSIEKRIHKANARELVDRASLKALRSLSFLLTLNSCSKLAVIVLNEILLPFSKQYVCVFFSLFSFSYLDYICIFCFFFSSNLLFKYTFMKQSNPERTLNCNDDERDSA